MTMPNEALNAVVATRGFLFDLLDPSKTPRVPASVRATARRLVKHYPFECEVEVAGRGVAKVKIKASRR